MRQPHWKSYKNAETVTFFHFMLKITETYDLSAMHLSEVIKPLLPLFTELEHVFGRPKKSAHTALLVELDKDRDKGLRIIKKAIDFNLLHIRTDKVQAIQNIEAVFNRYGGTSILDLNYASKTATVSILCQTLLNNSGLQEDLKLLDLEDLVVYLNEKNESFEDTFLERTRRQQKSNFQEVKTSLISSYRNFIKTLEARAFLDRSLSYNSLMGEINNLVVKFNREVKPKLKKTNQVVSTLQLKSKLVVSYSSARWRYAPQNSPQTLPSPVKDKLGPFYFTTSSNGLSYEQKLDDSASFL